jgi:hypothetical protein
MSSSLLRTQTEIRPFDSIRKRDFDLIFFHTEEYPFKIVQTACKSDWCHIALILVLTDFEFSEIRRMYRESSTDREPRTVRDDLRQTDGSRAKRVYILESTTDVYPCAITGKASNGVKICLLSERLSAGICGYKNVTKQKVEQKNAAKRILMYDIVPRILGIPYERNLFNLVKAWTHWLGCCYVRTYDETSMFCTEMITHVFTQLGVLRAEHGLSDPPMISYSFLEIQKGKETTVKRAENYTDEDLVLEDYVFLELNFLKKDCWLSYGELKLVKIG